MSHEGAATGTHAKVSYFGSPFSQPTSPHRPHRVDETDEPSFVVLPRPRMYLGSTAAAASSSSKSRGPGGHASPSSSDALSLTAFISELLGDATGQLAMARLQEIFNIAASDFAACGDVSHLQHRGAVLSLLQLIRDLASAAAIQRRRRLTVTNDQPIGAPLRWPGASQAAQPDNKRASKVSVPTTVPCREHADLSQSASPFPTMHPYTSSPVGSELAAGLASAEPSPKAFHHHANRPKRQAVCFPDGGATSRRQSTAFYDRAELGGEDHDGTFTINQHIVLMQLGRGAQGEVFLAMDGDANELRAIKAIPRPATILANGSDAAPRTALELARDSKRAQLQREIAIMKKCRHRNIVSLYEVIDDPSLDVMYLVMQYVDKGPIATMRSDGTIEKRIEGGVLADYALQIAKGLRYLHRSGIIHRDIKPDNILLGSKGDVYLADFGVSELFDDGGDSSVAGTRGTLAFLAPELFVMNKGDSSTKSNSGNETSSHAMISVATTTRSSRSPEVNGEAVDVWALGVTLYTLLFGRVPWRSTNVMDLMVEVTSATVDSITFPLVVDQDTVSKAVEPNPPPPPLTPSPPRIPSQASYARPHNDESLHTLFGDDFLTPPAEGAPDPLAATRRVNSMGRRMLTDASPSSSTSVHEQWTTLLRGMLHPDPASRYSVASILTAVASIQESLKSTEPERSTSPMTPDTPVASQSITTLSRHRRSIFDVLLHRSGHANENPASR